MKTKIAVLVSVLVLLLWPASSSGAGVTIITHGLNGNADGWVTGMANQIPNHHNFRGTNYSFYKVYFYYSGGVYYPTNSRIGGGLPSATDSGEIIVAFDWSQLANGNSFTTYQIANVLKSVLLSTNFISELNGHALCELPIHLIGHSRGGSVMCQTSFLLGTNGVWVDHLTTLDPHPLNDPNFPADWLLYSAIDAPCATYQNVLFHDNYWQNNALFVYGESVSGAYIRQLYNLSGGYGSDHSNVHLWYHGTVDERDPANDTEAQITDTEFSAWYVPYENYGLNAGFLWSLIGGGDRTSTDSPLGFATPMIRSGYNQYYGDIGAGANANRTALLSNNGTWPNVVKFNLVGTNQLQQGTNAAFAIYFQWAQPNTTNATISLYLDDDFNPLNANSQLLKQVTVTGTGASGSSISYWSSASPLMVGLNATNALVGYHALYAKIMSGGKTRYLYAPEIIQVLPAVIITTQPTNQTMWAGANATFNLTASGVPTLKYQWRKNGSNITGATNANFTTNNVAALAAGTYSCLVSNAFGNATSSNAVLTVLVPDTTKPTNAITAPTSGQRWSNEVFTVTGKAGDNVQVSNVWYQINGLDWNPASTGNNWSNWTTQIMLTPGTNTIAAYSVDTSGNFSLTNSVNFQYVATNQLQVFANGLGTIAPNYNNSWLEIGRNYSMTATPATGFVVTNWTISTNWLGGRIINNATVQFMMASNLTLQINFSDVTKPTLTVTSPTSGKKMTNALATVVGTAKDNWKVGGVWYQLNGGVWRMADTVNNFTNWTSTLTLIVGTNTIKSFAQDWGGNFSATNILSVVSSNTFKLQLAFTNALPMKTNGLVFNLQLSSGLNGHIQVSTNLINWSTLTNFVGTNSTLTFRDSAATNSSQRFYRAVIP